MVLSQIFAYFGHARLVLVLIEGGPVFLGIGAHGAELVDGKRAAESANTFLLENGRSAIFALDKNIADEEKGRENDDADRCYGEVDSSFHVAF